MESKPRKGLRPLSWNASGVVQHSASLPERRGEEARAVYGGLRGRLELRGPLAASHPKGRRHQGLCGSGFGPWPRCADGAVATKTVGFGCVFGGFGPFYDVLGPFAVVNGLESGL